MIIRQHFPRLQKPGFKTQDTIIPRKATWCLHYLAIRTSGFLKSSSHTVSPCPCPRHVQISLQYGIGQSIASQELQLNGVEIPGSIFYDGCKISVNREQASSCTKNICHSTCQCVTHSGKSMGRLKCWFCGFSILYHLDFTRIIWLPAREANNDQNFSRNSKTQGNTECDTARQKQKVGGWGEHCRRELTSKR